MTYISAIVERCYGKPYEGCNSDPYCTAVPVLYPAEEVPDFDTVPLSVWLDQRNMSYGDFIARYDRPPMPPRPLQSAQQAL
jgi:hypothetical protein